jgi:aminoglycoside 3-N-acetyltransferase
MGERKAIERAGECPATIDSLRSDLLALGLRSGMTVLVHSSLSALGWVSGGPVAVILALEMVLGDGGTLIMPTHSTDLSDPAHWQNPPVPQAWWEVIRETMPAYDPDLSHTRGMGIIPETFRKQRGVIRSSHPLDSFAARGAAAHFICADHSLDYGLGERSPLARLYESEGWVLLLGVGHENNTSLHLAEYRAEYASKKVVINGAPILVEGNRQWVKIQDIDLNSDDFMTIGADYETETSQVLRGYVAQGEAMLMPQKTLVDYGVQWMEKNRQ